MFNEKLGIFPSVLVKELPHDWNKSTRSLLVIDKYDPVESNELAIKVGDIIQFLVEVSDGWWFGKVNENLGIFPSNFVRELPPDWEESTRDFLAVCHYDTSESDKLAFHMGDVVQFISEIRNGWSFGKFNEKLGIFPLNFVRELPPDRDKIRRKLLAVEMYAAPVQSNELAIRVGDIIEFMVEVSHGWCFGKCNENLGIFPSNLVRELPPDWNISPRLFKVHESFNSESIDRLCLASGDMIQFVLDHDGNWFWGRIDEQIGKFPRSHVTEILDEQISRTAKASNIVQATSVISSYPCYLDKLKKYLEVIFPYEAGSTTELDLAVGDLIEFIEEVEDGWYRGSNLKNGKTGIFPSNFVTELSDFDSYLRGLGANFSNKSSPEMDLFNQDFYQSDIMSLLECSICLDLCAGRIQV
ncbi:SH3 domain-containing kinase-binding protein 1-like isoform X2 [Folsomia candida]|nr:SH3 domain-containing kinase-binding protein 1-like isoform X2 [Folsomia candida]